MSEAAPSGAYSGVRVLDFTQGVAGPMAAMLLGDLGAEVLKIEPPEGDRNRHAPGYLAFNRNKAVLRLDLEDPDGMARARGLIAGADVALFDHSPSRLKALGLTADSLTAEHPALIHAWTPPYGVEGRLSELRPDHSLLAAATGWGWRQAGEGNLPVQMVLPVAWYGQAVMGAAIIGAALLERRRSGRGQGVVVSGLHGFAEVGFPLRILKEPPLTRGVPAGGNPRYRLYRCSDGGFFFLGTLFPNFYRKVFETLGYGDAADLLMADDEGALTLLSEVFATRPLGEWIELLQAGGVPCAPVGEREAWFASETVREAGLRLRLEDPRLGPVEMPAPAVAFSQTPARVVSLPREIAGAPAWEARAANAGRGERLAPLEGVRVLNLGTVIAGAYPGALLSYLGADVVKVEPPEGDPFRYDPTFLAFNRGARTLGLDLKHPDGRQAFLDLARQADVVIDNYRPGVRERLGIDDAALRAVNPRIISCSISAYGDAGSRHGRPGFDPLLQAEGGMMAAQGGRGDPVFLTIGVNDIAAAGMVCASVIAALNARERSGLGQEIKTSLAAMSLLFQTGELVDYAGRPANDTGAWDCVGTRALHRHYRCFDDWIAVACDDSTEAVGLAKALGVELGDPAAALLEPVDGPLAERLEAAFAQRRREHVLDALHRFGAPAVAVVRTLEVFQNDWLWANDYLEFWRHPVRGPAISARGYGVLSKTPCAFRRPSPELAQHSGEVLREFGFPPDRISALMSSGAVFERPLPAGAERALDL
jgi:crotonobetainyl-CoA:carnitine CoA-transferase CaiB-like acyl-CoA transferase